MRSLPGRTVDGQIARPRVLLVTRHSQLALELRRQGFDVHVAGIDILNASRHANEASADAVVFDAPQAEQAYALLDGLRASGCPLPALILLRNDDAARMRTLLDDPLVRLLTIPVAMTEMQIVLLELIAIARAGMEETATAADAVVAPEARESNDARSAVMDVGADAQPEPGVVTPRSTRRLVPWLRSRSARGSLGGAGEKESDGPVLGEPLPPTPWADSHPVAVCRIQLSEPEDAIPRLTGPLPASFLDDLLGRPVAGARSANSLLIPQEEPLMMAPESSRVMDDTAGDAQDAALHEDEQPDVTKEGHESNPPLLTVVETGDLPSAEALTLSPALISPAKAETTTGPFAHQPSSDWEPLAPAPSDTLSGDTGVDHSCGDGDEAVDDATREPSLEDLADALADSVAAAAAADASAVFTRAAEGWRLVAHRGARPAETQLELADDSWIVEKVILASRVLVIADTDLLRQQLSYVPLASRRSLVALPFADRLLVLAGRNEGSFTENEIKAAIRVCADFVNPSAMQPTRGADRPPGVSTWARRRRS